MTLRTYDVALQFNMSLLEKLTPSGEETSPAVLKGASGKLVGHWSRKQALADCYGLIGDIHFEIGKSSLAHTFYKRGY